VKRTGFDAIDLPASPSANEGEDVLYYGKCCCA
jgi:hypothetical protein